MLGPRSWNGMLSLSSPSIHCGWRGRLPSTSLTGPVARPRLWIWGRERSLPVRPMLRSADLRRLRGCTLLGHFARATLWSIRMLSVLCRGEWVLVVVPCGCCERWGLLHGWVISDLFGCGTVLEGCHRVRCYFWRGFVGM